MSQENAKPKKKRTKFVVAIGVLIALAGGIIFFAGMASLGWDFSQLDHEELTAAEFTSENDYVFDSVTLEGSWNYQIVRGDKFRVDYFTSNLADVTCSETLDDTTGKAAFKLSEDWTGTWYYRIAGLMHGFKRGSVNVVITVPEDEAVTLTVNGSSADVTVEDINFKNINIEGSSANVSLTSVIAENITLTGSSLDAVLTGVTADAVKLDGSSANIHIENSQIDSLDITGSSIDAVLTETDVAGKVSMNGSSANLSMTDSSAVEVRLYGSSVDFTSKRVDIKNSFYGEGSSLNAQINLAGSIRDVKRVSTDGSSASARIDENGDGKFSKDEKYNDGKAYNDRGPDAYKTFEVYGSSVDLELTFTE